MGLSTAEFGRLTLRQFHAMLERLEAADRRAFLRAGIVAAMVGNSAPFGDPERKPLSPLDFVPGAKRESETPKVMSWQEQAGVLQGILGCGPSVG